MIKIIIRGKETFDAVCARCGCKFTYQLEDLKRMACSEYVCCPDCGEEYYHPAQR